MLNRDIEQKILSSLSGHVLSTSMVSRKTKMSRITVSKYLNALAGKSVVQAVRVGKAVAWRMNEHKPTVAIMAKTGTARIVKLALGEKYNYVLATNTNSVPEAFVLITDNKQYVRLSEIPVILVGGFDSQAYSLPELFDVTTLKALVKKALQEQLAPSVNAVATITVEHIDGLEEALGVEKADELLKLVSRLLREHKVIAKQHERTTFLVEESIAEGVLVDIEQTFHLILSHVYGRMVTPGELTIAEGVSHTVPSLTMTVSAYDELDAVNN